jgi:hypothetical protein
MTHDISPTRQPIYDMESGVAGVRLASRDDEDEIFALLMILHSENGMFGVNPKKVRDGIKWATERKGGIIFVIEEDQRLIATLGMLIVCDWYSDDEYLLERWNFVHPEYRARRKNYARMLLEQAKWASDWFRSRGKVMPFQCGINSFDRTEAKVRLYARHMPCIGAFFIYGLPPRQQEKAQAEISRIEQRNWANRKENVVKVRPVVETILRVGKRESDHV